MSPSSPLGSDALNVKETLCWTCGIRQSETCIELKCNDEAAAAVPVKSATMQVVSIFDGV